MNILKKETGNYLKIADMIFFVLGMLLIVIKGFTPEYLDAQGFLHEAFFLLPLGFGCLFISLLILAVRLFRCFLTRIN